METPQPSTNIRNFKPHAKFNEEEDERLKEVVSRLGDYDWNLIAQEMPGRNARQCKERWSYYLSPSLNTSPWTEEEDKLLLLKQRELGSKWVKISKFFLNRTDAMVKNRFQVLMRKMKKGCLTFPYEQKQPVYQISNVPSIVSVNHTDVITQQPENRSDPSSPIESSAEPSIFDTDFDDLFQGDDFVFDNFIDF
ncbi:Myb-like DNA-binding domain containing protein [Histomonas meleagridis]|uniref:Myb-like DNA-binding domain containing protein n=1 Tax=Histomonas meleagridis TaxID=135588 RepID=UPI003559E8AE|nr:Myb-like DNA-binding domain containing protein [Histomonas meleagridis]KAH0798902.1 Myb-like DNA-binding domain containing protein [Histomonas meleagridis]